MFRPSKVLTPEQIAGVALTGKEAVTPCFNGKTIVSFILRLSCIRSASLIFHPRLLLTCFLGTYSEG